MENIISAAVGRTHALYVVTSAWTETGVTWNTLPTFSSTISDQVVVPLIASCVDFDVRSDVQAWVDGTADFGWLLKDTNETAGLTDVDYASREFNPSGDRPQLTITYIP